jgi:hypothetical protein
MNEQVVMGLEEYVEIALDVVVAVACRQAHVPH